MCVSTHEHGRFGGAQNSSLTYPRMRGEVILARHVLRRRRLFTAAVRYSALRKARSWFGMEGKTVPKSESLV
eukprot:6199287-Pleurochrysis_carterae.AAC.2